MKKAKIKNKTKLNKKNWIEYNKLKKKANEIKYIKTREKYIYNENKKKLND